MRLNQLAVERDPEDEAGWWNLGIAATALRDWPEARRAWRAAGIEIDDGDDEVRMVAADGCVRLAGGETVWGNRIDPVRLRILNIPLIDSGRHFGDIVLHDGAPNGARIKNGQEFPVFDELQLWQESKNSTFQVHLELGAPDSLDVLTKVLDAEWLGIEDWSTVTILCAQCSQGIPEPHEHPPAGSGHYALAGPTKERLIAALDRWVQLASGNGYSNLVMVSAA